MKHLKGFSQLFEARGDEYTIMRAIENSLEAEDLLVLEPEWKTRIDAGWKMFTPVNTGKVYFTPPAMMAKTYIFKPYEEWAIESTGSGGKFSLKYFDTIPKAIRGLWVGYLAKNIENPGIKKPDYIKWLEDINNIAPGRKLSLSEIEMKYMDSNGITAPEDMSILTNSKEFNILKKVFNIKDDEWISKKIFTFNWYPCFPFNIGRNKHKNGDHTVRMKITVGNKTGIEDRKNISITFKGEDDFKRLLIKFLKKAQDRNWNHITQNAMGMNLTDQHTMDWLEDYGWIKEFSNVIFDGLINKNGNLKDAEKLLENKLEELKRLNPVLYSSIAPIISKTDLFPEISSKIFGDKQSANIISGGRLLNKITEAP